jgi:hypothetical protein
MQIYHHPSTWANKCICTLSSWYVQSHAEHAKLGILACKCRPSICACTCIITIHARAYSHTLIHRHAELGILACKCRPSKCACTCIITIHASAYSHTLIHRHAKLGILACKCRPSICACTCIITIHASATHSQTCWAWDTCMQMQAFNMCMYSSNSCRCIQ